MKNSPSKKLSDQLLAFEKQIAETGEFEAYSKTVESYLIRSSNCPYEIEDSPSLEDLDNYCMSALTLARIKACKFYKFKLSLYMQSENEGVEEYEH